MSDLDFFDMEEYDDGDDENINEIYLTFSLEKRLFAAPVAHVVEIIKMLPITEVPEMPDFVKGVINLRGGIIPVFDLRLRFLLSEREYDQNTRIIIVELNERVVGLIVDDTHDVERIPEDDIKPPPKFEDDFGSRFIRGIGRVGEDVRIVLYLDNLLTRSESEEITKIVPAATGE